MNVFVAQTSDFDRYFFQLADRPGSRIKNLSMNILHSFVANDALSGRAIPTGAYELASQKS
jgi:hypothetical protein